MSLSEIKAIAEAYWTLRDAGDLSDARTQAHNALLDALESANITFYDREDAAMIGFLMMHGFFDEDFQDSE